MRRRGTQGMLFAGKEDDRGKYLYSLLGKINYVRLTRPDDTWFLEAEKWVREQLSER